MIELSSKAMASKVKTINLFLLKDTNTTKKIKKNLSKKNNIYIYEISFFEKIIIKFGILSKNMNKKILNSDLVFLHNTKLIRNFAKFFNIIPIILFFHTDKKKQLKKMEYVNRVFTVNSKMQKNINSYFKKEKALLLPNCINFKNFKSTSKKNTTKFKIGTMCRLVEKKGIGQLIKLFKEIPDMDLVIAGDGPLMEYFKKLAHGHNNIKLLGWVENKKNFFSQIDLFCSSSKIEPFGLVLLEAMARGVPVISTNCDGPNDIIKHDYNGILFNKDNFNELRDNLYKLKNNLSLRKKIIKNGLDTIKKNYTIETYTENLFSLLKNI